MLKAMLKAILYLLEEEQDIEVLRPYALAIPKIGVALAEDGDGDCTACQRIMGLLEEIV